MAKGPIQQSIEEKILKAYDPEFWAVVNESHMHSAPLGHESHFKVLIVSDSFQGMNRVKRQQQVFQLLDSERLAGIHALSMRLLTVQEYSQNGADGFQSPSCRSKGN